MQFKTNCIAFKTNDEIKAISFFTTTQQTQHRCFLSSAKGQRQY